MLKKFIISLAVLALLTSCSKKEPTYSEDVLWLIDSLELTENSVVADIGAGNGRQAIEIARHVGPNGKVYATELGDEAIETLRSSTERSNMENITVLEGHPAKTNLPAECCDAIYLRRVYHHVAQPDSMNLSILRSLKPGARLAIIDFEPDGTEGDPGNRDKGDSHGITTGTLTDELNRAGFEQTSDVQFKGRYYYLIFQKPDMADSM